MADFGRPRVAPPAAAPPIPAAATGLAPLPDALGASGLLQAWRPAVLGWSRAGEEGPPLGGRGNGERVCMLATAAAVLSAAAWPLGGAGRCRARSGDGDSGRCACGLWRKSAYAAVEPADSGRDLYGMHLRRVRVCSPSACAQLCSVRTGSSSCCMALGSPWMTPPPTPSGWWGRPAPHPPPAPPPRPPSSSCPSGCCPCCRTRPARGGTPPVDLKLAAPGWLVRPGDLQLCQLV